MEGSAKLINQNNEKDGYYNEVNKILILILILNLIVAAAKIITGAVFNILSMMSDGYDSFFDGISNITGIIALVIARKPEDKEHQYGHSKAETFASIFIAILLLIVCEGILNSAIDRFYGVGIPNITLISFIVLIITLLINVFVTRYEYKKGVELKSDLLISDSKHTKSDIYATLMILIGMVFIKLGFPILDPILSIVMAIIILKTGLEILKDNINILMDKSVLDENQIRNIIYEEDEIINVHNIRTRGTPAMVYLDMHLVICGSLPLKDAYNIVCKCQKNIKDKIPEIKDIVVHLESEEGLKDEIHYE